MDTEFVKLAKEEIPAFNASFLDMVESGREKEASVSTQAFTRNVLRENSFAEQILTPIDITNEELHPAEDPELLVRWVDREPDVSPAASVPFGTVPNKFQYKGDRYPVYFHRILSDEYTKDIDKLRGYSYDIRSVMLNNSTKQIATRIDTYFLELLERSIGSLNTSNKAISGWDLPQNISITGGINRENFAEATNFIKRLRVPFGPTQTDGGENKGCMLLNNVTATEFLKFHRGEVGGDLAQDQWVNGLPSRDLLGVKPIYTIKHDLVPDGVVWFFSSEEFLGKFLRLQNLQVFIENKAFFVNWFQYLTLGIALGNVRGAVKVTFE